MPFPSETSDAESAAEMTVLSALQDRPLFPIEIEPRKGQSSQEIKAAVERCDATGWIEIGPVSHYDPRAHLTPFGRTMLGSRQR